MNTTESDHSSSLSMSSTSFSIPQDSSSTVPLLFQILSEIRGIRQDYESISKKVEHIESVQNNLFYSSDYGSSSRRATTDYPGSPSSVGLDPGYIRFKSPSTFSYNAFSTFTWKMRPSTKFKLQTLAISDIIFERPVSATGSPDFHAKDAPISPQTTSFPHETSSVDAQKSESTSPQKPKRASKPSQYPYRVVLTTYPGQVGINPLELNWGHPDPKVRGPVLVSRHPSSIRFRNSIGAHGGSYCIYHALSIAIGALPATHRPDLEHTEPPVRIGPHPAWGDPARIVSMDPWGHLVTAEFAHALGTGLDIRPSIAITKAHMRIPEIEDAVRTHRLAVDGTIVLNSDGELRVTKAAVEPVWYLPGVAARFGVEEAVLRRAIFEDTGGMYPELITRPDLKVFLPPIGGLTVYIFGQVHDISNPEKELTLRVHDECNGSDVFGSDICTCRPYLMYGIEKSVMTAQNGGCGVIVYFRKEGRALGEVTKYLVYNARKRSGDLASTYFQKTENVAGVKDARFQALMPDILHWLGIKKIDHMMSMSNMKYDAIVESGIEIRERCPIPDSLIPPDSRVEIDAKIAAGYFTTGEIPDLNAVDAAKGRTWEWDEINH